MNIIQLLVIPIMKTIYFTAYRQVFFEKKIVEILLDFFGLKDLNIHADDITTQENYGANGRPDIIIENDDCKVFIENKILERTSLTDNQPKSYLDILNIPNKKIKKLIFLLPDNYKHEDELDWRIQSCDKDKICTKKKWSDLINELEKLNNTILSDLLTDCITYLKNTVNITREETTIFTQVEKNFLQQNKIPSVYIYLKKILNINFIQPKIENWFSEYGIGQTYEVSNKKLFIGISPSSIFPYSFAIWSKEKYFETFVLEDMVYEPYCDNKKDSGGCWTYYKLEKDDFSNTENLKKIINKIISRLKKTSTS